MTPAAYGDARNREIIRTSLDESLIVEASAGTGKTTELVNRIVAVLRTGRARIEQVVAVTFTNKAAGELKVRLRQELDVARKNACGGELNYLEQAIEHLEEAAIGTIHAFCAQVLGERPVEARVDPGFQQMEEGEQQRIFERAFQHWFERALNEERNGLRRALSRVAWNSTRADDTPSEQLRFAGRALIEWRDFRTKWRREPFYRATELRELGKLILALAQRTRQCKRPKDPLVTSLRPVCDMERWITRARVHAKPDYDVIEALMLKLLADLKGFKQTGRGLFATELTREQVIAERNSLIVQLEYFKRRADADFAAELQNDMLDLIDVYEELKQRSGKLDFVDLLVKVRDLVRDNEEVRGYLQRRFTHFFIDEFQDTDPVQEEMLLLLTAGDPRETDWKRVIPEPGKLFIVGDPKQSVYRFRRADVMLYQDVRDRLRDQGVRVLPMTVSHRAPWTIQQCVNAAFEGEMEESRERGQPGYVPLEGERAPIDGQPAVVVVPAPRPWGQTRVTKTAIDACLPDAIAGFVEWLVKESGWKVRGAADSEALVPIEERHITILFRRFLNFGQDMTRPYVRSLEARSIRHLLVGSKSYHQREEIETLRAAFAAVEWPSDELSVYATLRGSLFAIPDNLLLRYRLEVGHLHPLRPTADLGDVFASIAESLATLAELHRGRNHRPVAETLNLLLEAARAHAGFALRPGGHQVVGNVYRLADLARSYELSGGISFRGFVEELSRRADRTDGSEAPLVEESADGVRLMTVHTAKGLEFPVVILADMTANIAARDPDRHLDPVRGLCAMRLMRCAPYELAEHESEERARDAAEGVRIAYVAATRARDLLVVPGIGDFPNFEGWLSPLNKAIYPPKLAWSRPEPAPGCPTFGERTVLSDDPRNDGPCIRPGLYNPEAGTHEVVWWDPNALRLNVEAHGGLTNYRILSGTSDSSAVAYKSWRSAREEVRARGCVPTIEIANPTDMADPPAGIVVELLSTSPSKDRPYGPRFGTLVHVLLNLAVGGAEARSVAASIARSLGCADDETDAAVLAATAALQHPLLQRALAAARRYRELPVSLRLDDAHIIEGVIDLAFEEDGAWCVVDYKTDAPAGPLLGKYQRQVGWYGEALRRITGKPVRCYLLAV
jgi:ATP-dependent helicase/nuclease subunit A